MVGVNWFLGGVIGLAAGMIAERLVNRRFSIFGKLVAGLAGALGVGVAAEWLQFRLPPGAATHFVLSLLGATVLLALLSLFRKSR